MNLSVDIGVLKNAKYVRILPEKDAKRPLIWGTTNVKKWEQALDSFSDQHKMVVENNSRAAPRSKVDLALDPGRLLVECASCHCNMTRDRILASLARFTLPQLICNGVSPRPDGWTFVSLGPGFLGQDALLLPKLAQWQGETKPVDIVLIDHCFLPFVGKVEQMFGNSDKSKQDLLPAFELIEADLSTDSAKAYSNVMAYRLATFVELMTRLDVTIGSVSIFDTTDRYWKSLETDDRLYADVFVAIDWLDEIGGLFLDSRMMYEQRMMRVRNRYSQVFLSMWSSSVVCRKKKNKDGVGRKPAIFCERYTWTDGKRTSSSLFKLVTSNETWDTAVGIWQIWRHVKSRKQRVKGYVAAFALVLIFSALVFFGLIILL